jgi:hypothetical protein
VALSPSPLLLCFSDAHALPVRLRLGTVGQSINSWNDYTLLVYGIRLTVLAAVIHDHGAAEMSRRHNNTNVICFGGRVIAEARAIELLTLWLATPFDGDRHQHRVGMMDTLFVVDQPNAC